MNFVELLRTPVLQNTSGRLLLDRIKEEKGIMEFLDSRESGGRWNVDAGYLTLDFGRRNLRLDSGRWTLNPRPWTLDRGRWSQDAELWTLDSGHWILGSGLWTLDSGYWTVDIKILYSAKLWKQ